MAKFFFLSWLTLLSPLAVLADLSSPVVDDAKLFSVVEAQGLVSELDELRTQSNIWFVIHTIPSLPFRVRSLKTTPKRNSASGRSELQTLTMAFS